MKLASFYGLTAPYMVMLYNKHGREKFTEFAMLLDNPVDSMYLTQARFELQHFQKAIDSLPYEFVQKAVIEEYSAEESMASFNHGKILGYTGDVNALRLKVQRNLVIGTVQNLLSASTNRFIDCNTFGDDIRASIVASVNDKMETEAFSLSDTKPMIRKISRLFIDRRNQNMDTTKLDSFNIRLMKEFHIEKVCAHQIDIDGKVIDLTEDAYKVVQYFCDNVNVINEILPILSPGIKSSTEIFDVPFSDIVHRKPRFLLGAVTRSLNATNISQSQFLERARDNVQQQLDTFTEMYKESVVTVAETESDFGLSFSYAVALVGDTEQSVEPLKMMLYSGEINPENLQEETLYSLIDLFKILEMFTVVELNNFFDLDLDVEGWESMISILNSVQCYGFNLQTTALAINFIRNASFNLFTKVKITEESNAEFKFILHEIQSLLDTIRPIGGEIV